jgi:hypothetical protein
MSTFQRRVPVIFFPTWSAILREMIYTERDVVATTVHRVNRRSMAEAMGGLLCERKR